MKLFELHKSIKFYVVLFIFGILLIFISNFNTNKTNNTKEQFYNTDLEKSIVSVIKKTYDVTTVEVIITYDSYGEKIPDYDYERKVSDNDNIYFKKTLNGKTNNQPFIKTEKLPDVRGALISVSGISENQINDIRLAVSTLLGVSVNKVNVICGGLK